MITAKPRGSQIPHAEATRLADVPVLDTAAFRRHLLEEVGGGARVSAFFGQSRDAQSVRLYLVLTYPASGTISLAATDVGDAYPSLTPDCPQVHWFEREIAEQW